MATNPILVRVRRDQSGQIYSEVINKDLPKNCWGHDDGVVIDRVRGRGLDQETVCRRAEMLARVLNTKVEQNLEWPCVAAKKLPCKCPECIKRRGC